MNAIPDVSRVVQTRYWLVNALKRTADFREAKAEQYPDDLRNARSARALRSAADYLQDSKDLVAGKPSRSLVKLTDLYDAAKESGLATPASHDPFPGLEAQKVASRYYFEEEPEPSNEQTHERLLNEIYVATLKDLSDTGVSDVSPLGKLLRKTVGAPTDPEMLMLRTIHAAIIEGGFDVQSARVKQLFEISTILVRLADTAFLEADETGRFPQLYQPTRVPLMRKQLSIAVIAFEKLGGERLNLTEKICTEAAEFRDQTISAIHSALDEVKRTLEAERVIVNAWLYPFGGGKVVMRRDIEVPNIWSSIAIDGKTYRPQGLTQEYIDGDEVVVWHRYEELPAA